MKDVLRWARLGSLRQFPTPMDGYWGTPISTHFVRGVIYQASSDNYRQGEITMKTSVVVIVVFLMLGGCATTTIPVQESHPGTYDPALPAHFLTSSANTGTLIVVRDSGFLGSACKDVVSVDAQEVGYVHPAQELTVYLPPGQHEVYAEMGEHSICATSRTSAIFTVVAGRTIIMDIHLQQNGGLTITPQNIGNSSTAY